MADATYQPKVYRKQGGDEIIVASGGKITVESSGVIDGSTAIGSFKFAAGEIVAADLGSSAVETDKLADLAVTAAKLGSSAVETAKLADLAVTAAKLGSSAVETDKLADLAVTAAKLGSSAVEAAKLANDIITASKLSIATEGSSEPAILVHHDIVVPHTSGGSTVELVVKHRLQIIDVTALKTGGSATASTSVVTVQLKTSTDGAISDAMSIKVADKAIVRAAELDDALHIIAAGGTIKVTKVGVGDSTVVDGDQSSIIRITGVRRST